MSVGNRLEHNDLLNIGAGVHLVLNASPEAAIKEGYIETFARIGDIIHAANQAGGVGGTFVVDGDVPINPFVGRIEEERDRIGAPRYANVSEVRFSGEEMARVLAALISAMSVMERVGNPTDPQDRSALDKLLAVTQMARYAAPDATMNDEVFVMTFDAGLSADLYAEGDEQ